MSLKGSQQEDAWSNNQGRGALWREGRRAARSPAGSPKPGRPEDMRHSPPLRTRSLQGRGRGQGVGAALTSGPKQGGCIPNLWSLGLLRRPGKKADTESACTRGHTRREHVYPDVWTHTQAKLVGMCPSRSQTFGTSLLSTPPRCPAPHPLLGSKHHQPYVFSPQRFLRPFTCPQHLRGVLSSPPPGSVGRGHPSHTLHTSPSDQGLHQPGDGGRCPSKQPKGMGDCKGWKRHPGRCPLVQSYLGWKVRLPRRSVPAPPCKQPEAHPPTSVRGYEQHPPQ